MVKVPDPNQGLGTLSGIIGLKQQQQALQTGQYQQATAQAESQQAQQKNTELQKAQTIALQGAQSGKYTKADGSLDRQRMADDISTVAPTYGQGISGQLLSQANEIVSNKQALQNLNVSQRKQVGDTLAAAANDPQLDHSKAIDALTQLSEDNPSLARLTHSFAASLPPGATPEQLRGALQRAAYATTGSSGATPSTVDTGGSIQPGTTSPVSGAFTPAGAPIPKTMAPHQVVNAAGQISNVAPTGSVNVAPGNANPTTAQATVQNTQAAGVAQRVQQAQAAANNTTQAQDALTRARAILDSPDSPNTGANFENKQYVKNFLAGAGIDTKGADDANTLAKNLARYEASRATQAGLGGTDAARELAHNGSPNVSLDKGALKGVITQSLATEKALSAYAGIQSKTKDPNALAKNEADFRSIPNLIEGYEYGLARNPQEANEFLQKHGINRADMAKTRAQIKEFESRGQ